MLSETILPSSSSTLLERQNRIIREEAKDPNHLLKQMIWAYLLLLIFEGGLRRWVLPGLATPLLIIRDPLALIIITMAWKRRIPFSNMYTTSLFIISFLGIFTAVFLGHGSLIVALFGARLFLLHFPLIFIIGRVFKFDDVIKMGKVILWISIPMTVLIAVQFYSPQSAWVNRGVGGDLNGAGFNGALGFFRPPATFSFIIGTAMFYNFVSVFVFYFWFYPTRINRVLLIASSLCLVASIPLSISRSLFFSIAVTLIFSLIGILRKPKHISKIFQISIFLFIAIICLSTTSFFKTGTEAFMSRFDNANEMEGGVKGVLADRYLGGMIGALRNCLQQPFFGYGMGMGTNVGSMLLTNGVTYLIDEGEWGRLIGEMGAVMGLFAIFIRLHLCFKLAVNSFKQITADNLLPWMLLSNALLNIPQGQWGQPTVLGFSTLIGGLLIASLKTPKNNKKILY